VETGLWRATAIFTRPEVEQISDVRIPEDRRVLYALKGIAERSSTGAPSDSLKRVRLHGSFRACDWRPSFVGDRPFILFHASMSLPGRLKRCRRRRVAPVDPTPHLLFDKSAFQALGDKTHAVVRNQYNVVTARTLLYEVAGDLRQDRSFRTKTPEQHAATLANKFGGPVNEHRDWRDICRSVKRHRDVTPLRH
jgi:hypothetical protein